MWRRDVLREQAGDGSGSASGGPSDAGQSAGASGAVAPAMVPGAGASGDGSNITASLLASAASLDITAAPAAGEPAPTIDPATGRPSNVPERFWNAETKAVDSEKVLAAYAAAEKRIGSGDIRPKTPEDYKSDDVLKAAIERQGGDIKLDPSLGRRERESLLARARGLLALLVEAERLPRLLRDRLARRAAGQCAQSTDALSAFCLVHAATPPRRRSRWYCASASRHSSHTGSPCCR